MTTLPSLFISHGAPTFALEPGRAGEQLAALGRMLRRPHAVLVVSPHWMTRNVQVMAAAHPQTIHDFGGFPRPLYSLRYPAPGAPQLATRVHGALKAAGIDASLDSTRGFDHGAWVPLMHLYPEADVPIVQVSLPFDADESSAFELGRALAPLVSEGVLVVGSGSLTHNLHEFRSADAQEAAYVGEFSAWVRQAVLQGDMQRLVHALDQAPHAKRAHPTSEHFLPLLVAAGAAARALPATVLDGGVRHGMLAMESYVFGERVPIEVGDAVNA